MLGVSGVAAEDGAGGGFVVFVVSGVVHAEDGRCYPRQVGGGRGPFGAVPAAGAGAGAGPVPVLRVGVFGGRVPLLLLGVAAARDHGGGVVEEAHLGGFARVRLRRGMVYTLVNVPK